jgi:uncharacterized repeat protein (TIGR01451 family)
MRGKVLWVISVLVLLSMLAVPVNAKPFGIFSDQELNQGKNPGGKLQFEPAHTSEITLVGKPDAVVMPSLVKITTRRNAGSELETGLQSIAISDLTTQSFGLEQATLTSQELSQDPTIGNPYDNLNDGTTFYINATVPAGALRLVAEITVAEASDVDMYVGTGNLPSSATLKCASANVTAFEYCDITNPTAGSWWILVQNWAASTNPPDLVTLASAVVTAQDLGNMTVEGPTSVPAGVPFDIRLFWNTPAMKAGDRWYGAFSLGTDAGHPGNIATIPVNIIRADDDVIKTASTVMAKPGDVVTYTITVQPNVFSEDLSYLITDTVPAGMTYKPGSASASKGTVNVIGDDVNWSVSMPVPVYGYAMTTNANDPNCDTVFGGYVNLENFGFYPDPDVHGDSVLYQAFTGGDPFNFYGNSYQGLAFTDDGFAIFDPTTNYKGLPQIPQSIPDPAFPNDVLAVLWQDMQINYDAATNSGVTLVTSGSNIIVIEYDNMHLATGGGANWDFEIVMRRAVDNSPGAYEIVYAYNNINGPLPGPLTIGLENALGDQATALVNHAAATNVLSNGFMACFDYVPLGDEPAVLTYAATINLDTPSGTLLTNHAVHNTDNPGSLPAVTSFSIRAALISYLPMIAKISH